MKFMVIFGSGTTHDYEVKHVATRAFFDRSESKEDSLML